MYYIEGAIVFSSKVDIGMRNEAEMKLNCFGV